MKYCSKLVWSYWAVTTVLLVGVLAGYGEGMLDRGLSNGHHLRLLGQPCFHDF
jgi:hypothetical protein